MVVNKIMLRDPNDSSQDDMNKFWVSFKSWYEQSKVVEEYFSGEYVQYDNWGEGRYYLDIDYEEEYKMYYGTSFSQITMNEEVNSLEELQDYIEIMYAKWIKTEKHYAFTVEINKRFDKFHLPYRLSSGSVISKQYKTTEKVEIILNHRMFERKITFSEQMILSSDLLDKKCALDYIVDALQYYISIQDEQKIEKKYAEAAKTVNADTNSKVYSVVKNEINEVMKLSNDYFDIRHNEYLNKAKEKREPLDDIQFIEYLYNRVYALLYLLRLKVKSERLITEKSDGKK